MNNLTTIREALKYSFHLGIHSDLEWFTNLQHRAILALNALESAPEAVLSGTEDNGHSGTPNVHAETSCPWPPGECEE